MENSRKNFETISIMMFGQFGVQYDCFHLQIVHCHIERHREERAAGRFDVGARS